jgi:hypothetical protein
VKPLFIVWIGGLKKKQWIRENNRCGSHSWNRIWSGTIETEQQIWENELSGNDRGFTVHNGLQPGSTNLFKGSMIVWWYWCLTGQWLSWLGKQLEVVAEMGNPSLIICPNMVAHISLTKIMGFRGMEYSLSIKYSRQVQQCDLINNNLKGHENLP